MWNYSNKPADWHLYPSDIAHLEAHFAVLGRFSTADADAKTPAAFLHVLVFISMYARTYTGSYVWSKIHTEKSLILLLGKAVTWVLLLSNGYLGYRCFLFINLKVCSLQTWGKLIIVYLKGKFALSNYKNIIELCGRKKSVRLWCSKYKSNSCFDSIFLIEMPN